MIRPVRLLVLLANIYILGNNNRFSNLAKVDYFSLHGEDNEYDDSSIREFLESDDLTVLAAINHGDKLIFNHFISDDENCLVFYKIPKIGTGIAQRSSIDINETAPLLGILTLEGGLAKSIYNSISRVFSTHVVKKIQYSPDLEALIENLHSSLSTTLGLPQSSIHSIQHEISFWNEKTQNASSRSDKDAAILFAESIEKLNQLLRNAATINSLKEFLDTIHTQLDEIWRLPQNYPQNRMFDLMDIISSNVTEFCTDRLDEVEDIWDVKSLPVYQTLNDILEITESWIQVCDSLTRLFWPNYNRHAWIGGPHIPKIAANYLKRLQDIQAVRNVYKEIVCLFNEINQIDKSVRRIFVPFRDVSLCDISTIGEKKWMRAKEKYDQILEPIYEKISLILKSKLHTHLDNPKEIIHIFLKYETILKSADILELLSAERQHFLQSLHGLIKELKELLSEPRTCPDETDNSSICWETKELKLFQNELNQIDKVLFVIKDIEGYETIKNSLDDLKEETDKWLKTNFDQWRDQSLVAVSQGDLILKDDKAVVEFEKDGRQLMQVTFKPKLVIFCNDVGEFENLGFCIPIELRSIALQAVKFMAHARKLQQIATFHNTIGDRMIPCVRPIMLQNALKLSNLVRSESVAWNDEDSVDRYISTLQVVVTNLSRDNNILTEYHEKIKQAVMKLMHTDLLRQGEVWREEMKNVRNIATKLETKGYTNLQAFKIHWDHQLYKVLEYQYLIGISDLSHRLPDIHVDIVFRHQEIQYRPSMEEIRSAYYSQLRRFIERPLTFIGLSEQSSNIFKAMVEINRHRFLALYDKAERLFNQLREFQEAWRPFVILGCLNLEDLCEVYLKTRDDWDKNFKACKQFSQQIAKIPGSESRIDCFVINTTPIRSDIEFISRKYWEVLTYSLRSSILKDLTTLQDFLNTSSHVLQTVTIIDEQYIEDSATKCEQIINELPMMAEVLKLVQAKDSCLAGWCRERVSALNGILNQWEQLQPLIDNHSAALKVQIDVLKNQLEFQMTNLKDEIEKFEIRWESTIDELERNEEANMDLFKDRLQGWAALEEQKEKLENSCQKYNMAFSTEIAEIYEKMTNEIQNQGQQWTDFEQFLTEYDNICAEEWTVYRRRPYILNDFISKWWGKITAIATEQKIATKRINKILDGLQTISPTLQILHTDGLTEKHWAKIFHLINKPYKPYHDISLKDILSDMNALVKHAPDIQQLVRKASSEQVVRQALAELDQWGVQAELKTFTHIDSTKNSVTLIKEFQDILNKIGDNQSLLQAAKNSSAYESYADQAEIWETRLNLIDHILTSLSHIQRKWIYLEPIFGAENPLSEGATFKQINKDFRYIMREIANDPRALSLVKIHGIRNIIDSLENQLNRCQNTLTAFINTKRNAFPRFYFLSDDDLLELLGQSNKESIIQKHIKKLFGGINRLHIEQKNDSISILKVLSAEGDEVQLLEPISVIGPVENWLNNLLKQIRTTLIDLIVKCCKIEQFTIDVIKMYPEQVICLVKSIQFTTKTEKAIISMNLQSHLKTIKNEIVQYTTNMNAVDDLTKIKIRSILLDLVHQATIVQQMIDENVITLQDWHWIQQMKFYLNPNTKLVTVKMVHAEFDYSYEYLGNVNRLVDTKLTHNCYLTLTQAMQLGLGGNPFGPAGTGKTECVKSLGGMLGRLVLVFNCSENVDVKAISLILSGLARCGAFGVFDEFNRLQESVLSVLSMIIQPIQTAIQQKSDSVTIFDEKVPLNLHCGIFVTLNPADEAYGGRQTLPSNLQAQFRPIVMQQPEPKEIARVILFVEGFEYAEAIGARMVELFSMAKKMLSPQRHYEWGLRELKTVLLACGRLLKQESLTKQRDENHEMRLAVNALRMNTMSKLTASDCKRFDMLIGYVFANTIIDYVQSNDLKSSVELAFEQLHMQSNEKQIEKCLQLYEQLEKRMGVVVFGPPNSGKTTIISLLKQAILNTGQIIKTYTISPKSMSRTQLLGQLVPDTRQWNDGALTSAAIAVSEENADVRSWIICDGEIDPDWIEALNSVLDDNKLLTLPSGWRIQFNDNINFIFETHDLIHASPATISRMGIVNLSVSDLDKSLILTSWTLKHNASEQFESFIQRFWFKALNWTTKNSIDVSRNGNITNILKYVDGVESQEEFCVRIIYSFGFSLELSYQNDFATKMFELADIFVPSDKEPKYCVYNKYRDAVEFIESDNSAKIDSIENIADCLIKTTKIKTYLNVLKIYLESNIPFIIIGPSGSGTSLLLRNVVNDISGYDLVTINCSSQLTASYVLYKLKQVALVVSGLRGREYKPKFNKIVLFLKNADLCNVDEYGTREVMELLIQLISRGGFYTETLEWINVTGLTVCCSMLNIKQHNFSPRFLSIVQTFYAEFPNDAELHLIMKNQFIPMSSHFKPSANVEQIVECLIEVYNNLKKHFTQDQHSHYIFTPKMLSKLIASLKYYPEEYFQQAFYNETKCIFRNRLTNEEDQKRFDAILNEASRRLFDIDESVYFFVPSGGQSTALQYTSQSDWTDIIKRNITICNTEDMALDTVITESILEITASICRILSRSESHVLLVGPTGSSKIDALHVACTYLGIKIASITPFKNYSLTNFYNDLKMVMQSAAIEEQHVVLYVDHSLISYLPEIMNPIEAVLEGSEIPNLFGDDLESIAMPIKNHALQDGFQDSLTAYFWSRVRQRLHIVLCLETSSNGINEMFENYPSLHKCTEIVWIPNTIISSPEYIAKEWIGKISLEPIPLPKYLHSLENRNNSWNFSPYRFKCLIFTYSALYKEMMTKIMKQQNTLQAGVAKLSSAHEVVHNLKQEAEKQEIALAEKREMANNALEMIATTMKSATNQKNDLIELKNKAQENSKLLMERKEAVELELKEVEPILKEAIAAVGQIKTEALSEIRSLRAPPDIIRDILEGVLRLMGTRDTSWNSMKSFLAKRGVKEDIRSLSPARISIESCIAVEKLLSAKADSFDVKNAKRASAAAAPLATWVIANVKYCKVVQSIKPLEVEQEQLQKNLRESENNMKLLKSGLDDVDARVKELSVQLNVYTQEAAVLELKLETARNTLTSSEVLVTKLSSEYENWKLQLQDINDNIDRIDLNAFIVAYCITHVSHLAYEHRKLYMDEMGTKLNINTEHVMNEILSEQDRIIWESMGLTPDIQSMENAALLTKILTTPFGATPIAMLNDPSKCAVNWLTKYLSSKEVDFELTTQHSDRFTYTLELAIRFGKVLLVNECNEIKPPLLSIISSSIQVRFNRKFIQVGNKLVDFNENFKVILASREPYITKKSGIIDAYITVIPFTTTIVGLTDQLMGKSIQVKQPTLETKRISLLQIESDLLKKRKELQEKLLLGLSESQGDILKNEKLLETLNEVKASSSKIDQSLHESVEIKRKLMQEYEQYKDVCSRAANLYVGINRIYSMPVNVFMSIYVKTISIEKDFDRRKVFEQVVKSTYTMSSRALPKDEHFALALNILKEAYPEMISEKEWESFIANFALIDESGEHSIPNWIKKSIASKVISLKMNHSDLYNSLNLENEQLWRPFMESTNITDIPVNISEFRKILVTQIFRPNLLIPMMTRSLSKLIMSNVPSETKPSVQQLLDETKENEPILFITNGEIDPSKEISDFVQYKIGLNRYIELAIGKGQEMAVMEQVKRAAENGLWICIKNVQLVPNWLNELNEVLQTISYQNGFRIWLICDSIQHFPQTLLNNCNKVLHEAPNSIKSKVQRLIQQWNAWLVKRQDSKLLKTYIALFLFNAVVQGRRSFVPQGWTKPYEFSDADLKAAIDIINWMEKSMSFKMEWSILKELCRLIAYGGRIDNDQDQRILKANFDEFFSDKTLTTSWSPLELNVSIPLSHNVRDYVAAIQQMPDADSPESFGLSVTTILVRDAIMCRNIFKQLRHSELSMDMKNFDKRIRPILSLWRKLNETVKLTSWSEISHVDTTESTSPWMLFIISEHLLAINLFKTIHNTLSTIHIAIKDLSSITRDTMNLIRTICENQVPFKWRQIWSGPRSIVDYIKAVASRCVEAENRFQSSSHIDFCDGIDFTKVFHVQSFLAALKLKNARELDTSTCELELISTLSHTLHNMNTTKAIVTSLQVDGAAWKDNKIVLNLPELGSPARIKNITITYAKKGLQIGKNVVDLPLYSNSTRSAEICNLRVSTFASSEAIVLSGAALIVPDI